jgi:uncharacterized protein YqjF (DUF2071 family)
VWRGLVERLSTVTPKHPIPMRTTFRDCFLVNFRMAPETLARVLPPPLEPDVYRGQAFLSVVIAEMEQMRPAFMPPALGITYQQVVYRAVVRCGDQRGVHFLRSDADNPLMVVMGNLLSFFRFHEARVVRASGAGLHHFDLVAASGDHADIHATFDVGRGSRAVPASSVFPDIDKAQRFLVELYTAFRPSSDGATMSSVDIERGRWHIRMVDAPRARFDLMDGSHPFPAGSTTLDSVIYVEDIEYLWHTVKHRTLLP